MTTEEKARAYDEALSRAKKEWSNNLDNAYKNYRERLEIIFPELAESDDERIRKELIEHIKANCVTGFLLFQKFSPDEIIAWLEKQGEKPKELDLEKEIAKYLFPISVQDIQYEPFTQMEQCAKHFFELGLQKGI